MKIRIASLLGIVLLLGTLGTSAFAQDTSKGEVFLEYSYLRFNPTLPSVNNRSFNGGGGGATLFFGKNFGIKGEFMGYGSTSFTTTVVSPIVTSRGTIPVGTFQSQANMFTYLFGPVFRVETSKAAPFVEVLFGGSNSNGYVNLARNINAAGGTLTFSTSGTQHPFTMAVGGGVDFKVSPRFAIRPIEIDYVLTRYTNPFTSTNNQNNFRYLGGIVFRF